MVDQEQGERIGGFGKWKNSCHFGAHELSSTISYRYGRSEEKLIDNNIAITEQETNTVDNLIVYRICG